MSEHNRKKRKHAGVRDFFNGKAGRNLLLFLEVLLAVAFLAMPDLYYDPNATTFLMHFYADSITICGGLWIILVFLTVKKFHFSDRMNRIFTWAAGIGTPFLCFLWLEEYNNMQFWGPLSQIPVLYLVLDLLIYYAIYLLIVLVINSIKYASIVMVFLTAFFGIMNYELTIFRSMSFIASDIYSLVTAISVANTYSVQIDVDTAEFFMLALVLMALLMKIRHQRLFRWKGRLVYLAACVAVWVCFVNVYVYSDFLENIGVDFRVYRPQFKYRFYGTLLTTVRTFGYLHVEVPEDYSVEKTEDLVASIRDGSYYETEPATETTGTTGDGTAPEADTTAGDAAETTQTAAAGNAAGTTQTAAAGDTGGTTQAAAAGDAAGTTQVAAAGDAAGTTQTATTAGNAAGNTQAAQEATTEEKKAPKAVQEKKPNVIVVMNESFADLKEVGDLEVSEDYMPFFRSLTKNTIKGYTYSSVFGGNTANSEFEFLTGNTLAFLPDNAVPYQLFLRTKTPGLTYTLKDQGYTPCFALHPYYKTGYGRYKVYPLMGFDHFYTSDDFSVFTPTVNYHITDSADYQKLISLYEQREDKDKPFYLFNVTMQNHGSYTGSTLETGDRVQIEGSLSYFSKTEEYLNMIRMSDDALKELISYFSDVEDPTVIVFFGDHQPDLDEFFYEQLLGQSLDTLEGEDLEQLYKVPFLIWTNYDIEEETVERTSMNYLSTYLAEVGGIETTDYLDYLTRLRDDVPAINALGYWGVDGTYYEVDDKTSPYYDEIHDYNLLEYNNLFGKDEQISSFFYIEDSDEE